MGTVIEGSQLYSALGTCYQQWGMDEVTLRLRETRQDLTYQLKKGGFVLKSSALVVLDVVLFP